MGTLPLIGLPTSGRGSKSPA